MLIFPKQIHWQCFYIYSFMEQGPKFRFFKCHANICFVAGHLLITLTALVKHVSIHSLKKQTKQKQLKLKDEVVWTCGPCSSSAPWPPDPHHKHCCVVLDDLAGLAGRIKHCQANSCFLWCQQAASGVTPSRPRRSLTWISAVASACRAAAKTARSRSRRSAACKNNTGRY